MNSTIQQFNNSTIFKMLKRLSLAAALLLASSGTQEVLAQEPACQQQNTNLGCYPGGDISSSDGDNGFTFCGTNANLDKEYTYTFN